MRIICSLRGPDDVDFKLLITVVLYKLLGLPVCIMRAYGRTCARTCTLPFDAAAVVRYLQSPTQNAHDPSACISLIPWY